MDGHCDHRLRVGDRHRMGCFCGVYLSWIVNRAIQNHDHRVDLSIDPPCYDVDDRKMDVSRGLRMNDRLDGLSSGVNLDASRGLRMSDLLVDRNLDASSDGNLYRRTNELQDDLNLDVKMDVSRDLRMNDQLDDHLMDGKKSHRVDLSIDPECYVLVGHHTNVTDDRNDLNLDVSHVNRNCARHDLKLDVNLDVMNHHVK